MKTELISVIIPVYKVEKYINRCVESVLVQNYHNIEVILVDDGSPDNCGIICDKYAETDSRIKVIHKKNGGLSDARNAGLDIATGQYICFIDSDDYIEKEYEDIDVIYEWCAKHVPWQRDKIKMLPKDQRPRWMEQEITDMSELWRCQSGCCSDTGLSILQHRFPDKGSVPACHEYLFYPE